MKIVCLKHHSFVFLQHNSLQSPSKKVFLGCVNSWIKQPRKRLFEVLCERTHKWWFLGFRLTWWLQLIWKKVGLWLKVSDSAWIRPRPCIQVVSLYVREKPQLKIWATCDLRHDSVVSSTLSETGDWWFGFPQKQQISKHSVEKPTVSWNTVW